MYQITDKVLWKGKVCIVTNANAIPLRGKIEISPVGNGNDPAKYFKVLPEEVKPYSPASVN